MVEQQANQQQKPIVIARACSIEEMLNILSDKLDYLMAKLNEKK